MKVAFLLERQNYYRLFGPIVDRALERLQRLARQDHVGEDQAGLDVDLDAADVTTRSYNAVAGRLVPLLAKERAGLVKELAAANEELLKYKKSSPALRNASTAPASAGDSELSFAQRVEQRFAGA